MSPPLKQRTCEVAGCTRKHTESIVEHILRDLHAGHMARAVARRYGTTDQVVSSIRRGKSWKHVTRPEGF